MPLAVVDWTLVIVAFIGAFFGAVPATLAAVFAFLIRRDVRTPSGDAIGHVVERTHDLSAIDVALSHAVLRQATGKPADPEGVRNTLGRLLDETRADALLEETNGDD